MPEALEDQRIRFPDRAVGAPRVWVEPTARRVRAVLGGVALVDSTGALLLFETEHLPVYYVPIADVRMDLLTATGRRTHCPLKGDASYWTVTVGDRVAENAVWGYPDPLPGCPDISRHVALYWNKMDAWYEEDDEVFVHPRSPYHRVDVLSSSRHVRVVVAGETVAETRRPRLLFETGLPTRYYIPKADVRMDLLEPTATVTQCPYKGKASYWSAGSGTRSWRTSPGATRSPSRSAPRSSSSSPSTTSGWRRCTSTGNSSRCRRPPGPSGRADLAAAGPRRRNGARLGGHDDTKPGELRVLAWPPCGNRSRSAARSRGLFCPVSQRSQVDIRRMTRPGGLCPVPAPGRAGRQRRVTGTPVRRALGTPGAGPGST